MEQEWQEEQRHFDRTMEMLRQNAAEYRAREKKLKQESDELYAAVTKGGETELYNQLAASLSILEHTRNTLRKNEAALNRPYFGRIDYEDLEQNCFASLYVCFHVPDVVFDFLGLLLICVPAPSCEHLDSIVNSRVVACSHHHSVRQVMCHHVVHDQRRW